VLKTAETKLKMIADCDALELAVVRNVEADLRCYKEYPTEMKKPTLQPALHSFFKKPDDSHSENSVL
jgi:hypothetical protein